MRQRRKRIPPDTEIFPAASADEENATAADTHSLPHVHELERCDGAMELRAQEPVRLEKADIYPTKELDALRIRLKIANQTGCEEEGELHFELKDELGSCLLSGEKKLPVTKAEVQYGSFFLELPEGMTQWSEFTPVLYHMEFVFRQEKEKAILRRPLAFVTWR